MCTPLSEHALLRALSLLNSEDIIAALGLVLGIEAPRTDILVGPLVIACLLGALGPVLRVVGRR